MANVHIEIRQVAGALGAEIGGVDLADVSEGQIEAIRDALLRHRVLFFRGQELGAGEQLAFAGRFGPVTKAHPTVPGLTSEPRVFDIDSASGTRTNVWHTDVTFIDRPPLGSVLRAVTIPPFGGDTVFANTVTAYAGLPASMRAFIDGLDAVHTNAFDYARALASVSDGDLEQVQRYGQVFSSTTFRTRHPLVQLHPETGERALLAGGFARQIEGLPSKESRAVLDLIDEHVTSLENTVRWRWAPGDVVFWDNRATQHYAVADYGDAPRRVQRVTIGGTVPTGVDGRRSAALEGDSSEYLAADALVPA